MPDPESVYIYELTMPPVILQLQDIYKPIQSDLERVQQTISVQLTTPDEQLNPVLELLSQRQGKMIRPALVLLCGKLISDIRPEHIDFAAMVELIHMASLLHDDVIDKDSLRRGQPTANALWGNTAAVLLGDFLLSRAFTLGALSKCNGATTILGQTAQTLCTGELKQNLLKGRWELSEADYFAIIAAKTAALFQCSCQLGALASGAAQEQLEAVSDFGYEFGMAFQIADDLRDILSTEKLEGKTVGTDFREGKITLPLIHWIGQDIERRQHRIDQLKKLTDLRQLIEQLELTQSIHYASMQARTKTERAKQILNQFGSGPARDTLLVMTDKIVADIC